jgi:hypothetical protein
VELVPLVRIFQRIHPWSKSIDLPRRGPICRPPAFPLGTVIAPRFSRGTIRSSCSKTSRWRGSSFTSSTRILNESPLRPFLQRSNKGASRTRRRRVAQPIHTRHTLNTKRFPPGLRLHPSQQRPISRSRRQHPRPIAGPHNRPPRPSPHSRLRRRLRLRSVDFFRREVLSRLRGWSPRAIAAFSCTARRTGRWWPIPRVASCVHCRMTARHVVEER